MNKDTKETKKEKYLANRKALIEKSKAARELIEMGEVDTVNEGLIYLYSFNTTIKEFNTFREWKEKGYTIKKGSKAYFVWGQPRKVPQTTDENEEKEFKYWPLCYLFADDQVIKKGKPQQEENPKAEEPKPKKINTPELVL